MYRLSLVLFVLLAILSNGCKSILQSYTLFEGRNYNDMIAEIGPPARVVQNGKDGRILVYEKVTSMNLTPTQTLTTKTVAGFYQNTTTTHKRGTTLRTLHQYMFWVGQDGVIYRSAYSRQ